MCAVVATVLCRRAPRAATSPTRLRVEVDFNQRKFFRSDLINVRCCSHGAVSPCPGSNVTDAPRHSEAATTFMR